MENIRRLNQSARKAIRKEQLTHYFQVRRSQLLQNLQMEQWSENNHFDIEERRQKMLIYWESILQEESEVQWTPAVLGLRKSLSYFKQNVQPLFSKAILGRLFNALDEELPQQLTSSVLELVIDLLDMSGREKQAITAKILDYDPVRKVIALAHSPYRLFHDRVLATVFLSRLILHKPSLRQEIVCQGVGSLLLGQVRQLFEEKKMDEVVILIEASLNILSTSLNKNQLACKQLSLDLLQQFLCLFATQQLPGSALIPFLQIIAALLDLDNQKAHQLVYYTPGYPQKLLQLMAEKQVRIHSAALLNIAYLSYADNKNITLGLIRSGVIEKLEILVNSCSLISIANMIIIIGNNLVTVAPDIVAQSSTICNFIIKMFPTDEKHNVIAFLNNAVEKMSWEHLQKFICQFNVLEILTETLENLQKYEENTTKETISSLIRICSQFLKNDDRDRQILRLLYSNVSAFIGKIKGNQVLEELAEKIIDAIREVQLDEYSFQL